MAYPGGGHAVRSAEWKWGHECPKMSCTFGEAQCGGLRPPAPAEWPDEAVPPREAGATHGPPESVAIPADSRTETGAGGFGEVPPLQSVVVWGIATPTPAEWTKAGRVGVVRPVNGRTLDRSRNGEIGGDAQRA